MSYTKQTTVITDHQSGTITINGVTRRAYPSPLGYRSRLSHAEVHALGFETRPGENYELIDGRSVRTLGEGSRRLVADLPILRDADIEPETTTIDPLPSPPIVIRPPRGKSRRYGPLIDAARDLAPLLPEGHSLRRALDRLNAE